MVKVLLPLISVVLIATLLIAPIGMGGSEFAQLLENAAHAPLFAVIAAGTWWWLRRFARFETVTTQYLIAGIVAVCLGGLSELAQLLSNWRDGSWVDFANDAIGATAGLAICACFDKRLALTSQSRRMCIAICALAAVSQFAPLALSGLNYWVRWRQLPTLVTWNTRFGHHFVKITDARASIIVNPSADDPDCATALELKPHSDGQWPGVTLTEPYPNWLHYTHLRWRAINPQSTPIFVSIRIDDQSHSGDFSDRYNERFALAPGLNTVDIPLARVQRAPATRELDLSNVATLIVFENGATGAMPFLLCDITLAN